MRIRNAPIVFGIATLLTLTACSAEEVTIPPPPTYTQKVGATPTTSSPTPAPVSVPSTSPVAPTASLATQVETAFYATYGDLKDWSFIISFDDRDAPRVTIATTMAYKDENRPEAMELCRAATSISDQITEPFSGVYVTAGEGGGFLAECNVP